MAPLAYRSRPDKFEDFEGLELLYRKNPFIKGDNFPSMIIWGPPGTGKTTLAQLLAQNSNKELYSFSAVLGGVNDLKKLIHSAQEMKQMFNKDAVIFIDEIHRFNKAQQDALLPYVEAGSFVLIGATTENPKVSINKALLSRLQLVELLRPSQEQLLNILVKAAKKFEIKCDDEVLEFISNFSNGDARKALNTLEILEKYQGNCQSLAELKPLLMANSRDYDRNQDRHYDVISAFIKSLRGSDPDAAILWLAVMLDGGEDPVFIARRLIIFASEDVGNADPQALTLAVSTLSAVQNIGMPEARICLAQASCYLASTVKSNASYLAMNEALDYVKNSPTIEVPEYLKNNSPQKKDYKYPHNFPEHFVKQSYSKQKLPTFYRPGDLGIEKNIKLRLEKLWQKD